MPLVTFPAVYLLHGMGGSPDGSVKQLELELVKYVAQQTFLRPPMPHADPHVQPSESVEYLRNLVIPEGALLVGISLGGLVAAKLQESDRPDLHVFCINSPTWAGDIELHVWQKHRVSLYSSRDKVIAGRSQDWTLLAAEAHDVEWLVGHNTDPHAPTLAYLISCYIQAGCFNWENR